MLWNSVVQRKQFQLSLECALKCSQNKCALTEIVPDLSHGCWIYFCVCVFLGNVVSFASVTLWSFSVFTTLGFSLQNQRLAALLNVVTIGNVVVAFPFKYSASLMIHLMIQLIHKLLLFLMFDSTMMP